MTNHSLRKMSNREKGTARNNIIKPSNTCLKKGESLLTLYMVNITILIRL